MAHVRVWLASFILGMIAEALFIDYVRQPDFVRLAGGTLEWGVLLGILGSLIVAIQDFTRQTSRRWRAAGARRPSMRAGLVISRLPPDELARAGTGHRSCLRGPERLIADRVKM